MLYDPNSNRASVETFGYKFSDTTVLNYQCTIELCKKATNECLGLSPPICGRHKRDLEGRKSLGTRLNANQVSMDDASNKQCSPFRST